MSTIITTNEIFIATSLIALAASFFGVFVVLRKMALTVDAMTHIALPGLGLGIVYGFNPFLGGFVMLAIGVILIYWIEEKTNLSAETIISILFTAALAIGVLIIPESHLVESLFGDISKLKMTDFWLLFGGSIIVLLTALKFFPQFARTAFSHEFAASEGINSRKFYLIYLYLLAFLVALGIKIVGTLLMGVLVVLPAATAKNISRNFKEMIFWSMFSGIIAGIFGIWIAIRYNLPPGPAVVLVASSLFLLSLAASKKYY